MNILLTSAGRRTYLVEYFKEALKEAGCQGLVHGANSRQSPALLAADRQVLTPLIYDKNYIPFLLDYCRQWEIGLLVPLFDIDIPVLAASREKFAQIGTQLAVPDQEAARLCNDKWKTCEFLKKQGLPVPGTWLQEQEACRAIEEGTASWPLIIKPRWGMGSLGIFQADDQEELRVLTRKCRESIRESYLKYEAAEDLDHCVLIQEKLKGQEYGMDVINDLEGNWRQTIVKKKIAMRSGETDEAVTVDNPQLKALGRRMGEGLKHRGNLDMDVMESQGQFYVLEMNARFGGGYPFSHSAGVNLPLALVFWAMGEEAPSGCLEGRSGVRAYKDIQIRMCQNEIQCEESL